MIDLDNGVKVNYKKIQTAGDGKKYHYILAYYRADRIFQAEQPKYVEKVQFKDNYKIVRKQKKRTKYGNSLKN